MLDFFRLTDLRDETAGSLSYGQQKLVDAAMAFMAGRGWCCSTSRRAG